MSKDLNLKSGEKIPKEGKVLVDFYADWCGPCKMMAPILDELSNEQSEVTILKVNVDEHRELAQEYSIMSIPTLILFNDGEVVDKHIGFAPKQNIMNFIK